MPALSLVGRVASLTSRTLAPRPVRGCVDEGALTRAHHAPPLPRVRSRQSQTRSSDCSRGRRVRSLSQSGRSRSRRERSHSSGRRRFRCDRKWSRGSRYRSRDRSQSRDRLLLSSDWSRSRERSWLPGRSHWDRAEAYGSSQDCCNSGLRVESAPAVAGTSIPQPKASLRGLARLFLSLLGFRAQWDVVAGSVFSAAASSGAGSLPGPAAPLPVAASSACTSASVPALGRGSPTSAAFVTGLAGRRELSRESSRSEQHHRRSSSREKPHLSKRRRGGRSPYPARSSRTRGCNASFPCWSFWRGWWSL